MQKQTIEHRKVKIILCQQSTYLK